MAFPAAIGVIWHATDGLAIRPDFSFSQSSSDSLSTATSSSGGIGISALFYVRKWDNLRAYLSPRLGYQRSSLRSAGSPDFSTSTNIYSYTGSFGAEYQLHRRFAIYAETGLGYSRTTDGGSSSSPPGISFSFATHNWGTRAGVGAIFYF